ncbi:MAG: Clp1/GlmU family protein [Candidatus Nezhaarchaeales archaeon]
MKYKEASGSVLKVEGPVSIRILEGEFSILGRRVVPKDTIVVPKGKSLPIEIVKDASFEVKAGVEAKISKVQNAIPPDWRISIDKILNEHGPLKVVVVGDVDSGKTTFTVYLANAAFNRGFKTAIIDADPGQAEISVPTTIGFGILKEAVITLDKVPLRNAFFVGSTSPADVPLRVMVGVNKLLNQALQEGVQIIILNTSGWVFGKGARELGASLINMVSPNFLVLIQRGLEVEHLARPWQGFKGMSVIRVSTSPAIKLRSKEERKDKRELAYKNLLTKSKIRKFDLSSVSLMYTLFNTGVPIPRSTLDELEKQIGAKLVYGEEKEDFIFIVLEKPSLNVAELAKKLKETTGKEAIVVTKGMEKGIIVGLLNQSGGLAGLGVINEIDYESRSIKVLTPIEEEVSVIQVGQLKLDDEGHETIKYPSPPL